MTPQGQDVRVEVDGRTLSLSNLDKVLYPRTGTTKGEVLNYYAQISPVLLPLLRDRPVTRVRWPHGVERDRFFEKNAPAGTPRWVRTADVPTTGARGGSRQARSPGAGDRLVYPIIDDLATLTWAANLAALELHVHQWTVTKQGKPRGADRLVIDLDPGDPAGLHECCQVALLVREKLAERRLDARAVTSGSKGMHLYATLPRRQDSEAVSAMAKELAEELQGEKPKLVTATMTKSKRSAARSSSTGRRTPAPRPRCRRTPCAGSSARPSRPRSRGRRSRRVPRTRSPWSSSATTRCSRGSRSAATSSRRERARLAHWLPSRAFDVAQSLPCLT